MSDGWIDGSNEERGSEHKIKYDWRTWAALALGMVWAVTLSNGLKGLQVMGKGCGKIAAAILHHCSTQQPDRQASSAGISSLEKTFVVACQIRNYICHSAADRPTDILTYARPTAREHWGFRNLQMPYFCGFDFFSASPNRQICKIVCRYS